MSTEQLNFNDDHRVKMFDSQDNKNIFSAHDRIIKSIFSKVLLVTKLLHQGPHNFLWSEASLLLEDILEISSLGHSG